MAVRLLDEAAVAGVLATIDLLAPASSTGLAALVRAGHQRALGKGVALFHQGDPSSEVFVLLDGRVEVSSVSADGRRQLHTSVLPPAVFGELGPLAGGARTASAVSVEPSLVWCSDISALESFLAAEPAATRALVASLARQVITTGALVDDLRGLDLRGRLAKRLLGLVSTSFDRLPPDGTAIPAIVTQADLADLASGSREQVTRILADLQRAGVVTRQRRRIVLSDVGTLARLAGLGQARAAPTATSTFR